MLEKDIELRPMMKIADMVPYLKNKNIKFECCSEQDAKMYLKENNNYYNVTSYKNNFVKYQCGELEGKYIDLDFAYLKDLSIIDYRTRLVLFKMIIKYIFKDKCNSRNFIKFHKRFKITIR